MRRCGRVPVTLATRALDIGVLAVMAFLTNQLGRQGSRAEGSLGLGF